jgi:TetR/AcrR family transcriptional repressor of bet genes
MILARDGGILLMAAREDMRRARGEATRRVLIEAAIDSVGRHGLSGTTLSTVAALAQMSRASVGFHFAGKDQLLAAALEHCLELYDASLRAAQDAAPPGDAARLAAIVRHDVGFPVRYPAVLALWFAVWGEAQALALYRAVTLPHDRRYRDAILALAVSIAGGRNVAARIASLLSAAIFGMWLEHHLDPDAYDVERNLAAALSLVDRLAS